jgi:hypothetical protein
LSALKSYQKTLSYTVIVPYSRVLSYIPIYSVFTTTRHTETLTYPLTVTPPPDVTSVSGVLTTTVPADCVSSPYIPPGGVPAGDTIDFPLYPDQPRGLVECCVVCHKTENCVAAAYDPDSDECEFLINVNNTSSGTEQRVSLREDGFCFFETAAGEDGECASGTL